MTRMPPGCLICAMGRRFMVEPVDTGEVNSFSLLGNTSPQCFPGMAGGGNSALAEKDGWMDKMVL